MVAKLAVLIPGKINPYLRARLEDDFEVTSIKYAGSHLLDKTQLGEIRAIASMTKIDADFIDALPNLGLIANFGVGYDAVDAEHAASKGIIVTNTPDVLTDEVADTTIGLLINTLRELPKAEAYLREGRWSKEGAYPLTNLTLRNRTVGIYGLGRIGLAIAQRLQAFGVAIRYHNRNQREGVDYAWDSSILALAKACDTLIVAVPGGNDTENVIDSTVLEALGKNGVLINIGRGTSVDEPALIEALDKGVIAAAGLDVFSKEPHVSEGLLALPNVSLLPHVASASMATRNAMADVVFDNLVAWSLNKPVLTPVTECLHLIDSSY